MTQRRQSGQEPSPAEPMPDTPPAGAAPTPAVGAAGYQGAVVCRGLERVSWKVQGLYKYLYYTYIDLGKELVRFRPNDSQP